MWSPASYKTRQPRGAAVPVEGLAGGVLGGGPQDGQRDRDLPWHGRHPGPHGLGGRRAVLGRGQQLRRGLVQQEHHRLRLRVRRAPVLADLDVEQRRRPGLHAELRDRGSRRGPGVRRRHVRPDELGARVPERHDAAGRDARRCRRARSRRRRSRSCSTSRSRRTSTTRRTARRRRRASTQYQFSGFREQEGATLTFTQTTTLKWFAVDPKGNTSAVQSATYYVIRRDLSDLDAAGAGDRQRQGRAGLDAHRRLRLHVPAANIRPPTCSSSTGR